MKFDFEYGVCDFALVEDKLINCRNKEKLPKSAKSIILFVFPYKIKEEKPRNISRYAAINDYHIIVMDYLNSIIADLKKEYPHNEFVGFTDNSPIPEVFAAASCGLGVKGKNGLLINEKYGSFVFIGEIVTDLYIEHTAQYGECINCGVCEKMCPVGLGKDKCLSAVTQKKKNLTDEEELQIKNSGCIWGCDICSEVCPMNKGKEKSNIKEFVNSYRDEYVPGEDMTNRPYAWRGAEVIIRNYNILCSKG